MTYGIKDIVSAETDFGKVVNSLKGDGSIAGDNNAVYYYVTEFLEKALTYLRKDDKGYRIVVFVDDLDRCSPDRALEVLESIESFFDIEGIVYVIGMDSETINSIIQKKYGEGFTVKGLDYLQKIVQLPFQIPTWKEIDIYHSISKIIAKGLEGSQLIKEFDEKNKMLIVKTVQLNPREVKRFINNIILAKSVFNKPVDELIAVQAFSFRREWNRFLELITPDESRRLFLNEYKNLKTMTSEEDLDKLNKGRPESERLSKDVLEIYHELFKHGSSLKSFLDVGAADTLLKIRDMEEYRRVLSTTKMPPEDSLLKLLTESKVDQFNNRRVQFSANSFNFIGAHLSRVNLAGINLSDVLMVLI